MCKMTEYHIRSDNMSAEIRLLIAALKMSQILSCGAKRPRGPMIPHNYKKWIIRVNFNSRHDCILYHVCVSDCS